MKNKETQESRFSASAIDRSFALCQPRIIILYVMQIQVLLITWVFIGMQKLNLLIITLAFNKFQFCPDHVLLSLNSMSVVITEFISCLLLPPNVPFNCMRFVLFVIFTPRYRSLKARFIQNHVCMIGHFMPLCKPTFREFIFRRPYVVPCPGWNPPDFLRI